MTVFEKWTLYLTAAGVALSLFGVVLSWLRAAKAVRTAEEGVAETRRQFSLTTRPKVIAELQPQQVPRSSGAAFTALRLILRNDGTGDAHRIDAKLVTGSTSRPPIHYTLDGLHAGKAHTLSDIPRFTEPLAVRGTIRFFGIDGTEWASIRREGDRFWDCQRAERSP